MKTWVILAMLALSPAAAFAHNSLAGPASETARASLLKEIEAYRAILLPQIEPIHPMTAIFQLSLNERKTEAAAAKTGAALAKARKRFEDWKAVALRHLFAEKNQAGAIVSLRQQLATQRVEAQVVAVRALIKNAQTAPHEWGGYFGGSPAGPGAVSAESPRAANDPARYAKVRQIMISSGARPDIVDAAIKEALRQGVDPCLVLEMIWQESKFKPGATSPAGARGLMQLMPSTGRDMGVSNPAMLYDVQTSLSSGIKYLRWSANYLKLNVNLADITTVPVNKLKALLASYNAGVGNVSKWLRSQGQDLTHIPFNETRHYVRVIGSKLANLIEFLGW